MLMLLKRRRMRRGVCVVLGCYCLFLFALLWKAGEKSLTNQPGLADAPEIHFPENENGRKMKAAGMADDPGADMSPETLDRVLQQQPWKLPSRRKLSKPDVQQVNVIVEDAPPGTFVKQAPNPEADDGFEDLQDDALEKPNPTLNKSRITDPHSLDELIAGDGVRKTRTEKTPTTKDNVHDHHSKVDVKEDSSFNDIEANEKDTEEEEKKNLGVWISPDGAVDSQTDTETDSSFSKTLPSKPSQQNLKHASEASARSRTPHTPASVSSSKRELAPTTFPVSSQAANFVEISDLIIYSAFFDYRLRVPLVRMMGLGPVSRRPPVGSLWCVFASASTEPAPVSVHQTSDCMRMKKYCFYMFHCQIPDSALKTDTSLNSVVLVSSETKDKPVNSHPGERVRLNVVVNKNVRSYDDDVRSASAAAHPPTFSVCVPPLFGKLTVLQLVEYIELNRLLGASHFVFYTFRVSREVSRVLNFYEEAGVVSVMPWNIPAPNDVWNKGESIAVGDCLYRNMHVFDYVVFSGINEFLVPQGGQSWQAFMNTVSSKAMKAKTATFEILPVKLYPNPALVNLSSKATVKSENSKFLTLRNTLRGKALSGNFTKLMVKPEKVFEVDSYFLVQPLSELFVSHKVDSHMASMYLFTSKMCSRLNSEMGSSGQTCDELREDRTIWQYKDALLEKTKTVLRTLNQQSDSSLSKQ